MPTLDETKTRLERRLQNLNARVDAIEGELRQPGDDDFSESATESEGDEVLEKLELLAEEEVRRIQIALKKIEAGTYGICSSCEDEIPAKRLAVVPFAAYCTPCAEEKAKSR